jgi:hypothetical protein
MKPGVFCSSTVARAAMLLCFSLALLGLGGPMAESQSQSQSQSQGDGQAQTQSGSTSSEAAPAAPADDAAAKAAERKKRFDEQRKLLESGVVPPKDDHRRRLDPDLLFSPYAANLLVHEELQFRLYDKGNVEVTSQGSYSAGPTRVANFYIVKGLPTVVAAGPGTATLSVVVGSHRYAEVIITVYPGDKLPKGVQRTTEARR